MPGRKARVTLRQAGAVGVDHGAPVVHEGPLRRLQPEREGGSVDDQHHLGKAGGQRAGHRGDRVGVAHVELDRQQRVAELAGERVQAVLATGGGDHAVAAL